jgi:hypothetical protein
MLLEFLSIPHLLPNKETSLGHPNSFAGKDLISLAKTDIRLQLFELGCQGNVEDFDLPSNTQFSSFSPI